MRARAMQAEQQKAFAIHLQMELARNHATILAGFIASGNAADNRFEEAGEIAAKVLAHWGFQSERADEGESQSQSSK